MLKSKILLVSSVCAVLLFAGCGSENLQCPTVPESKLIPEKVLQNELVPEQKQVEKEVIVPKKEQKKEKITPKIEKKVSHKCATSKCQDSGSLIYSVQFLCTSDKNIAQKEFENLKASNPDVRMHAYYEYQVLRLGRFNTRLEAEVLMNKFKENYPEICVVAFKPIK